MKKEQRNTPDRPPPVDGLKSIHKLLPTGTITILNPAWDERDSIQFEVTHALHVTGTEYFSAAQIAEIFDLPYDALRKRLQRFRNSLRGVADRVEMQHQNQPKYLYQLLDILPEIEALQCGKNVHRETNFKDFRRKQTVQDTKSTE